MATPENAGRMPAAFMAFSPRLGWIVYAVSVTVLALCAHCSLPCTRIPDSSKCATGAAANKARVRTTNGSRAAEMSALRVVQRPFAQAVPRELVDQFADALGGEQLILVGIHGEGPRCRAAVA